MPLRQLVEALLPFVFVLGRQQDGDDFVETPAYSFSDACQFGSAGGSCGLKPKVRSKRLA